MVQLLEERTGAKMSADFEVWQDEDATQWFAEGHIEPEDFLAEVERMEKEELFLDGDDLTGTDDWAVEAVIHFYMRQDPYHPDIMLKCREEDEGAEPYTKIWIS